MPPDYAAEMVPFDPLVGEFRVHYAGFFDPGFGYAGAGGAARARCSRCARARCRSSSSTARSSAVWSTRRCWRGPTRSTASGIGSNYQAQGLKLSKHFQGMSAMRWASLALVSLLAAVLMPAVSAQTSAATPAQMAEYLVKLAEYDAARAAYQVRAAPYWAAVKAKRASRTSERRAHREITLDDYVLTQPPEYTGPKKPINPASSAREMPVVADYLQHAAQQFDFAPEKPAGEIEFKRAYARVAAAAGLTRDLAVRVYAFEATGNGKYDLVAGQEFDPNAPAITTALGYNQLLSTNSVELLAEQGRAVHRDAEEPGGGSFRRAEGSAGEEDRGPAEDGDLCALGARRLECA